MTAVFRTSNAPMQPDGGHRRKIGKIAMPDPANTAGQARVIASPKNSQRKVGISNNAYNARLPKAHCRIITWGRVASRTFQLVGTPLPRRIASTKLLVERPSIMGAKRTSVPKRRNKGISGSVSSVY